MAQRIMVIDDEEEILRMLTKYFNFSGYEVTTANCASEALDKLSIQPDIILLDVNMPEMNGLDLCMKIRDFVTCPILFLTANTQDCDKIKGFSVGGDDYIEKPFSLDALGARVAAHIRREKRGREKSRVYFDDNMVIDYAERTLFYQNEEIPFLKKEFDIIEVLSLHPGQIFDKERLYTSAWKEDSDGFNSVVVEHIRKIRSKLAKVGADSYIETVWGVGYKWKKRDSE